MSKVKTITVHSKAPGGHRRAGMRWGADPTTVPATSLTAGQLKALEADPRLVLVGTEIDAPDGGEGKDPKGGKGAGQKS